MDQPPAEPASSNEKTLVTPSLSSQVLRFAGLAATNLFLALAIIYFLNHWPLAGITAVYEGY